MRAIFRPAPGYRSDAPAHRRESVGYVNWPVATHHDDGQGGMVVAAVFVGPEWVPPDERPAGHRCWDRAALVDPVEYGISARFDSVRPQRLIAWVPLGTSDGCWWSIDPETGEGCQECFRATRDDLTPEGLALVATLERLYGRTAQIVTTVDT